KQAGKWDQETIVSFFLCQYCSGEYLRYELQAYREILEKLPQEKQKITCLHKNASEKIYRLNGKIRAVSQLVMM
ncbi:hypothetical protein ACK4AA_21480, partial [Aeromonas veronii]